YALNKSQLVEKIASLIIERKVPQLTDVRDESTDQVRIVLELAAGADPDVAMAYLFKNTPIESAFNVNFTALVPGPNGSLRPEVLSLKSCLQHFIDFRIDVTKKRLAFERKKLLERIHILEGLVIIYDALDEALKIVRKSEGRSDSADKLRARFKLSEIQAFAVVDMKIYQLSRTNILEIREELKEKQKRVDEIDRILKSSARIREIVRQDLEGIAKKYGDKRRCKLVRDNVEIEFNAEDYVVHEDVYAIVTTDGWIKRIRQTNELASTRLREGDAIKRAHALSTVDSVAFFTNLGTLYVLKVADFPSSSGYGDPVQKILKFKDGETIVESFEVKAKTGEAPLLPAHELREGDKILLASRNGVGFALVVEGLDSLKRSGKRAIKLRDGDFLAAACRLENSIGLFTEKASGLIIPAKEVPERNTAAVGVSLISVRSDDRLVSVVSFNRQAKLKVTLSNGKITELPSGEVCSGHRALKGTKVVARGDIVSVEKVG
ncbi:MAG: hypothetical protein RL417_1066, partial [Pseudomonadota bacterium]